MKLSKQQHQDLKAAVLDIRFQDEFFQNTLQKLRTQNKAQNHDRVAKLWNQSKQALKHFAEQADIKGLHKVITERQRFIDQVILGKIKLFEGEAH